MSYNFMIAEGWQSFSEKRKKMGRSVDDPLASMLSTHDIPYHTVGDDHNGDSDNHLSGTRGLPYVAGNKWRDAVPSSLELREDDR
ncbi:hypothetical protein SAY86_015064 [Trapa natans]|uniref:Uncharacterized protein n=1 Tax=Trapa natans TaxID=22666 RepID=A0AAN7QGX0_TRANT|nr:hypothetical protein SAY86_015064 [Trapa natans]